MFLFEGISLNLCFKFTKVFIQNTRKNHVKKEAYDCFIGFTTNQVSTGDITTAGLGRHQVAGPASVVQMFSLFCRGPVLVSMAYGVIIMLLYTYVVV